MPRLLLSFLLVLLAAVVDAGEVAIAPQPSNGQGGKAGSFASETLKINGKDRVYRLYVPESYDPKKPLPLVFGFHGFLDSKEGMALYTQFENVAKAKDFIMVFPDGLDKSWKIVPLLSKDDFAFFDALYDHLGKQFNVDLNRVYLMGMSNGAFFSNFLASQRSEKVAAIAVHSGGLGVVGEKPDVKQKYAVFIAHGDKDNIVSVDEGRKERDVYTKAGHAVEYVEIPNHGHSWGLLQGIDDKIWKFFETHPRGTPAEAPQK